MNTPSPKPTEIAKCPFCGAAPHEDLGMVQHKGECLIAGFWFPLDWWNRRSAPETQAVAPIELFMCEIPRLTLKPGYPYIFGVDPECPKCAEYLSGSPVESAPALAPFEKDSVETYMSLTKEQLVGLLKSACDEIDRLSAVVEEVRGK